jgi:hypothetical protein
MTAGQSKTFFSIQFPAGSSPTRLFVISILFALILLSCGEKSSVSKTEGVVATVGSFEISDRHFTNHLKRFYLRTGQAANLNEDFRMGVINARIERYSIVEFARDQGWAADADARYNQAMIERKVLMEAYERHFIHDQVHITEDHMREVFRRHNSSIRASHLYARNRYEADSLYALLQQGRSFESLAAEVFQNPSLARSGGDLGFFTIDEMDIAFEDAAFNLRVGEISAPVRTSRGFSIIKVTDIVSNPIITEDQFARRRHATEQVARAQQFELATRRDMEERISSMDWNRELLREIWQVVNGDMQSWTFRGTELSELPLQLDERLRTAVLARYRGFSFTVQDFLHEAYFTPPQRRAMVRDLATFEEQAEGLAYRAFALGLIQNFDGLDRDYIQGSIDETFYSYLFERFEGFMDDQVQVDDRLVKAVFERDPAQFDQPLQLNMAELVLTDGELAGEVYEKLNAGADFRTMLRQYGAQVESRERNGEIGTRPITDFGTMAPALRNIQPGEVAGPFQVALNHYIILHCLGRTDPRPLSFEEAEPRVREHVFFTERLRLRDQFVRDLRLRYNATIDMQRLNSLSFEM